MNPKNMNLVFEVFEMHHEVIPLVVFDDDPFKILISTLLSSRTNDDTTLISSQRLFEIAPNCKKLATLNTDAIEKLIYPVGFYKTKAIQIKELSRQLVENHGSQVPNDFDSLIKLPGVGRKTANLVLSRAFGVKAISVDTHAHRISNLLGWVNTPSPAETELELMKIIPKNYWPDINRLFVGIGRKYKGKKLSEFLKREGLI
jgi:endonuclease III